MIEIDACVPLQILEHSTRSQPAFGVLLGTLNRVSGMLPLGSLQHEDTLARLETILDQDVVGWCCSQPLGDYAKDIESLVFI